MKKGRSKRPDPSFRWIVPSPVDPRSRCRPLPHPIHPKVAVRWVADEESAGAGSEAHAHARQNLVAIDVHVVIVELAVVRIAILALDVGARRQIVFEAGTDAVAV